LVNGQSVDLSPEAVISLDEESPVFERDSIPGGFSLPFSLPTTPRNRQILRFPDKVTRSGDTPSEFPFQLTSRGHLVDEGTLIVTETGQEYRCHLTISGGDFASRVGDKTLRSLRLGGERTFILKPEYCYPDDDFTLFPVYNPSFMEDTRFHSSWSGNKWRLNSYEDGAFYTSELATFAISPFPFLAYVLRCLFEEHGFRLTDSVFHSDAELRSLVLYTTRDIIQPKPVTTYHEIRYQSFNGMITRLVPVTNYQRVLDKFSLSDCMPDITIREFLISLRNMFNVAFVVNGTSVSIIRRKDLLQANPAKDITFMATQDPQVISVAHSKGAKLEWCHDNSDLNFSEGFNSIDDKLELIGDPVPTMDALFALDPRMNEIRLMESYDIYFQYAERDNPETGEPEYIWQQFSNSLQNLVLGNGEEVFSGKISTLLMIKLTRITGEPEIRVPWAEQKSNSVFRAQAEPFTARLLFYRGMQEDSQGGTYPLGSSDNFDFYGNPIPGANLSLRWQGESGLYKQLWESYLFWWNSRRQINYTILKPDQLRFDRVYMIQGVRVVLKKRTIRYTLKGFEPSPCEFYTI